MIIPCHVYQMKKKLHILNHCLRKMDHPPDIDFTDPTRHDKTKLDQQDFVEEDVEVLFS